MNIHYDVTYYINYIRSKIASVCPEDILCQQYAWWILKAICNKTKTELITQKTLMLSNTQKETINTWIHQIVVNKMPLQYILGSVPFADCDILVEPPVLIPRPETEELCLYIIKHLQLLDQKKIKILDICSGSGCIAIALSHHLPRVQIIALDISDQALELAKKNIEHNKIRNVTLIKSNLFESIPCGILFDMIVSNPPYITESEFNNLDESVKNWEDYNALVATDNGLEIIKKIIIQAPHFICINNEMRNKNIPQIVIEIGYKQGIIVKDFMNSLGYNNVLVHKDLEGKDRFVTGRVDYVVNSKT